MYVKINLIVLQEPKKIKKVKTWPILRSFGFSSLIRYPGMIW